MQSRHEHEGLVWVDLESPTRDEVRAIMSEFHIQPLIGEELLLPASKPHAEFLKGYVYLILHFPALRHSHKHREQEVDFVIGKQFLITTHYEAIDPIHNFSKVFEVDSALDANTIGDHAGFIFFAMLKRLYKGVEHELEFIRRDLTIIEEHIYSGEEVLMVEAISHVARDLLNLRQILEPHREVLHTMENEGAAFFGDDFVPYLRMLSNEYYKVHNHIMRLTESLHELRETNNSLLTTKQNETMKIFTIMAFVIFPLTLVAAIFSMDTKETPIVGAPHDFWIIVGMMALGASLMFIFFKRKKWL
jgi:magnesium transporter